MIDVFVERKGNCLHTQFPIRMDELAVQLASIGIRTVRVKNTGTWE